MLSVVRRVGAVEKIVVVASLAGRDVVTDDVITDVIVHGNDVDMTQSNVNSNAGVALPVEIGDLFRVGDVVGSFQLSGAQQVV